MAVKEKTTDKRASISDVKNIGDSSNRFIKGDFPTGDEYSDEEKMEIFRQKNYALVVMEIRAKSANVPFTLLVDNFSLHLEEGKEDENIKVISKKLENLIPQIGKLIKKWTEEMNA
jgi:hypothetical protein